MLDSQPQAGKTPKNKTGERYELYKRSKESMTIKELHNLVHSLWKTAKMDDLNEVMETGDEGLMLLLQKEYMPDRDYYEEVQPQVQLDLMLEELLSMLKTAKSHFGQEKGLHMLDIMEWNLLGLSRGNRFCRHPKQKIVSYK